MREPGARGRNLPARREPLRMTSEQRDEGRRRWGPDAAGGWSGRLGPGRLWFTGRAGGVSAPPFATLNLSRHVRDLPVAVEENRRRAAMRGAPTGEAVWGQLIHGSNVAWLSPAAAPGPGPVADGLLTASAGLTIAMTFADCVPIWLASRVSPVGGLLHAGWRGTVRGIARAGVEALVAAGAAAASLEAVIGPSIGPCCYEVGPELVDAVEALDLGPGLVDARRHLDLWEANRRLLCRAGMAEDHIAVTGLCTACHPEWFFSHRREGGRTGRNGGFFRMDSP